MSPRGNAFWKAIISIELGFRFWMIFYFWSPMDLIYTDMSRHWDNAAHFLKPGAMGASNPYFYQLWLWAVRTLTHDNRRAINVIVLLLSFAGLGVWYLLAREVVANKRTALIYTALLGAIPTHAFMFMYFMPETVLLPIAGAACWVTLRAIKRPGVLRFLGSVALWVCAILTKSVALPAAIVSCAWALWRQRRRRLLLLIPAMLIAMFGFGLAGKRAYDNFGRYTPLGDGSLVSIYFASGARDYQVSWGTKKKPMGTYVFSSPSFYISPFYPLKWETQRKGMVKFTLDPKQKGEDLQKTLREQLNANKAKLPRLIFENLLFLSFGHHWPLAGLDNRSGRICVYERVIWFPLILASTIACLFWLKRKFSYFPAIVLFATIALYGSQITVMEGRYRKFIEPMVLLAVVASAERWSQNRAQRRSTSKALKA